MTNEHKEIDLLRDLLRRKDAGTKLHLEEIESLRRELGEAVSILTHFNEGCTCFPYANDQCCAFLTKRNRGRVMENLRPDFYCNEHARARSSDGACIDCVKEKNDFLQDLGKNLRPEDIQSLILDLSEAKNLLQEYAICMLCRGAKKIHPIFGEPYPCKACRESGLTPRVDEFLAKRNRGG